MFTDFFIDRCTLVRNNFSFKTPKWTFSDLESISELKVRKTSSGYKDKKPVSRLFYELWLENTRPSP